VQARASSGSSASVEDWQMSPGLSSAFGLDSSSDPQPAQSVQRKAMTEPVQARGNLGGDVTAIAGHGVAGASSSLPYLDTIQRSFGSHDVSGTRVQVGGAATEASHAIGAQAYATGDRVAFSAAPDLHTAAHEAAHVVQQRAAVHLKGGVGEAGDPYEQHADRVADLVVQGRSAEAALAEGAHPSGGGGGAAVQRKMMFNEGTEYLDTDNGAGDAVPGYQSTINQAKEIPQTINVIGRAPARGTAAYVPIDSERAGEIFIAPLAAEAIEAKGGPYHSRLIEMAHETRHGIDDLTRTVKFRNNLVERIHTEWRAFATQAAVATNMLDGEKPVESRYQLDIAPFASVEAFMDPRSRMVATTSSYLRLYKIDEDPSVESTVAFMREHLDWVGEAVALFHSLAQPDNA
jgi:Domain of unknown function (DUF4157)